MRVKEETRDSPMKESKDWRMESSPEVDRRKAKREPKKIGRMKGRGVELGEDLVE